MPLFMNASGTSNSGGINPVGLRDRLSVEDRDRERERLVMPTAKKINLLPVHWPK